MDLYPLIVEDILRLQPLELMKFRLKTSSVLFIHHRSYEFGILFCSLAYLMI